MKTKCSKWTPFLIMGFMLFLFSWIYDAIEFKQINISIHNSNYFIVYDKDPFFFLFNIAISFAGIVYLSYLIVESLYCIKNFKLERGVNNKIIISSEIITVFLGLGFFGLLDVLGVDLWWRRADFDFGILLLTISTIVIILILVFFDEEEDTKVAFLCPKCKEAYVLDREETEIKCNKCDIPLVRYKALHKDSKPIEHKEEKSLEIKQKKEPIKEPKKEFDWWDID